MTRDLGLALKFHRFASFQVMPVLLVQKQPLGSKGWMIDFTGLTVSRGKHLCPCCCSCCWVASVVPNSVQPHRWQPTRLRHPWDSPGRNTGVGCHFLLQCMKVKSESERHSLVSNSLRPHRLYSPWNSPGQNTALGSLSLLQGIFPTGIKSRPPALQADSLPAEPTGKPKSTGVVAYPFSSRSSWPRNQTQVSCIAGGFFNNWAFREAPS